MHRPLLVGESNPYQPTQELADRYAFYPRPRKASGYRLCALVMGLPEALYLRSFDRLDLCHPRWSAPAARTRAARLLAERGEGDVIVLCGAKVAEAFGLSFKEHALTTVRRPGAPALVVLPHPSGLNRFWQEPRAFERARQVLVDAGVLPANKEIAAHG